MVKISGFYDEVTSDFEEQCKAVKAFGETYMCPRVVNGKNIANYTAEEFERDIKPIMDKYGVKFSSIGSPIGKIGLYDDEAYNAQLSKLEQLVKICELTDCKYIRIFSFRTGGTDYDKYFPVVVEKLRGYLAKVKGRDITLLHENEKRIYGDSPDRCIQLYRAIDDEQFKLCYDASNYIQCGYNPNDSYDKVKDYCVYYHIKDCSEYGVEVPVGMGKADYIAILKDLVVERGYDGYMTLEPHTGKYADHKILFQLLCWITWAIPYIGKWHRVFRRIDKAKGVGRWRSVDRSTIFKWQYEGLKSLLKEAGAEV